MKIIKDGESLSDAMRLSGAEDCLRQRKQELSVLEYEEGELLMSPLRKNTCLMFLLEGSIFFYILEENGHLISLARSEQRLMFGEMELFDETRDAIYVEARSAVRVLAVPFSVCHEEGKTNISFLRFLIRKMVEKSDYEEQLHSSIGSMTDRFLFYLRYLCENNLMTSVSAAAETLNCSERQLQRILKRLTAEGRLTRIGKGRYQLTER